MKKTLLTIAIIFFAAMVCGLTSCKKQAQLTTEQQLTGKWTMKTAIGNYTVLGTNRKDTTNYTAADYFEFKADGTLSIMENKTAHNGNWKLTNNKLFITNTNYIDYTKGFDITILTTSNLQLYSLETNTNTITEQKLNFVK